MNEIYLKAVNEAGFLFWKCFFCRVSKFSFTNMAVDIELLKSEIINLKGMFENSNPIFRAAETQETASYVHAKSVASSSDKLENRETVLANVKSVTGVTSHSDEAGNRDTVSRANTKSTDKPPPILEAKSIMSPTVAESSSSNRAVVDSDGYKVVRNKKREKRQKNRINGVFGSDMQPGDCNFSGVPRRTQIYVGRVQRQTGPEDITRYLQKKFPQDVFLSEDVYIGDIHRSFKVDVPLYLREELLKSINWPLNVYVGRFFPSKRSVFPRKDSGDSTTVTHPVVDKSSVCVKINDTCDDLISSGNQLTSDQNGVSIKPSSDSDRVLRSTTGSLKPKGCPDP